MCLAEDMDWLPPLITMAEHGGDWDRYLEALYERFTLDFLNGLPKVAGLPMGLKRHPLSQGKEATFWHFISEGKKEEDRIISPRRCERLCWVRPMIDAIGSDQVLAWVEDRPERSIIVTVSDFSFKLVIARRDGYFLPYTAYYLEYDRQREKLRRESQKCEVVK